MTKSKKLQKQIEKKLDKLQELLDEILETQNINSDDTDTWDSDALYNLVEKCKETLQLLEDQPIKGKFDDSGEPLYEDGLCTLVDEYQNEEEEDEAYD